MATDPCHAKSQTGSRHSANAFFRFVGWLFKPTRRVTDPTYSEIKKAQNKFYATHELFID